MAGEKSKIMGFFDGCINGGKTNYTEAAEGYYAESLERERRAAIKLQQEKEQQKGPRYHKFDASWDDMCLICGCGCRNQICGACKPLYDRGLRVAQAERITLDTEKVLDVMTQATTVHTTITSMVILHPRAFKHIYPYTHFEAGETKTLHGLNLKLDQQCPLNKVGVVYENIFTRDKTVSYY